MDTSQATSPHPLGFESHIRNEYLHGVYLQYGCKDESLPLLSGKI